MDKLWTHVENLGPGILLTGILWFVLRETPALISLAQRVHFAEAGPSAILTIFLLATSYTIGTANAAIARWVFTFIPLMVIVRWWCLQAWANADYLYLDRAMRAAFGFKSLDDARAFVLFGGRRPHASPFTRGQKMRAHLWRPRRMRLVYDVLIGRGLELQGAMAKEIQQRRIEARLLRAAVLPLALASFVAASLPQSGVPGWASWALVVILIAAYVYRECTITDTLAVYGRAIAVARWRVDDSYRPE